MLPYHRQLLFLFLTLSEGMVSEYHIIAIPTLDNKVLSDPLFGIRHSESISGCAVLCVDKCRFFSFHFQTGMCRHYCQWNNRTHTDTESGWRTYNKISLEVTGECIFVLTCTHVFCHSQKMFIFKIKQTIYPTLRFYHFLNLRN